MLTELGKMLKIICTKADIKQKEMAKSLGIATGKLSSIFNGKTVPNMDLLGKCIDRYEMKGKDIKALFSSAFSSTAKHNHTIVLDTRHFKKDRIDLLVKVITVLLLRRDLSGSWIIEHLVDCIKSCYSELDTLIEYQLPQHVKNTQNV